MRTPAEPTSLLQDAFVCRGHRLVVRCERLSDSCNFEFPASVFVEFWGHWLFPCWIYVQMSHLIPTMTTVYYGRTLSDASMLYFADVFLYFFMRALVGQTAERIFTKLSHVVGAICEPTRSIYSWPSWNYTVGQKMTKFCIFFDHTRTFTEGCSTLVPISTNFGLQTPEI